MSDVEDTNWFEEAVENALSIDPEDIGSDTDEIADLVFEYSDELLAEYAVKYPSVMDDEAATREGFETRLHQRWGQAFDNFEFFILLNHEVGSTFKQHLSEDDESSGTDPLFSALFRLHARACQVSREVLALIRAGYADGAFSRWRALYEIAISAQFISKHGKDTAERFLHHKIVDDYFEAELLQKHHEELGVKSFSDEEMEAIEERLKQMVDKYGGAFKQSYGWAHVELDDSPSRRTVAEDVGLDKYEPYFAFASDTVHGGAKGTLYRMGLTPDTQTEVMATGPTNTGFTDPAQFTVLMLAEVTEALLLNRENVTWSLVSTSVFKLTHEIIATFDDIRKQLEAEIAMAEGKGYTIGGRD